MPRPSPPPWVPKRLARPSRLQRSISFPRPTRSHAHCCCCLTRQHGGEQSGLVTLKVVSGSRVTSLMWATSVPILIFLHLSVLDLGPMYATDRQTGQTRIIAYRCVCYAQYGIRYLNLRMDDLWSHHATVRTLLHLYAVHTIRLLDELSATVAPCEHNVRRCWTLDRQFVQQSAVAFTLEVCGSSFSATYPTRTR